MTAGRILLGVAAALLAANSAYLAASRDSGPVHLANVLLHPLLALAAALLFLRWWRSWRQRGDLAASGALLLALSFLCGLLLPWLGSGGLRETILWGHIAGAVAGLLALAAGLWRQPGGRAVVAAVIAAAVGAALLGRLGPGRAESPLPWPNPPAAASLAEEAMGGAGGPFSPSAAGTASGAPLPAAFFAGGERLCGRCHQEEEVEWAASAHRHSGLGNPFFAHTFTLAWGEAGAATGRWCAGCHSPGLLLTGALAGAEMPAPASWETDPLAAAGVGCILCHSAGGARSSSGQGSYELASSPLLELAAADGALGRGLHDLLLRLDPEAHARAFSPGVLIGEASSLYCSTCHQAHVGEPVGDGRHFPVFDDYDPWQGSAESGQGTVRSLYAPPPRSCVDCHMEKGPEGRRSHRFPGANTALPALAGDRDQLAAVEAFLAGAKVSLDLFAAVPEGGPEGEEEVLAPLDRMPAALRRGESAVLEVVVRPRAVGHEFPGGKRDLQELWLELTAVDEEGRTLLASGLLTAEGEVDPGAHFFRARWIDAAGRRVDGHRAWEARAVVYDQRVEAAAAQVVHYRLEVPPQAGGRIRLKARLLHRSLPLAFSRAALAAAGRGEAELPLTVLAEARAEVAVVDAGSPRPPAPLSPAPDPEEWRRWNDYGIGLALQGDLRGAEAAFHRVAQLAPEQPDGWANLGRLAAVAGNLPQARQWLSKALEIDPALARARHFLGLTARNEGAFDEALGHFRQAAELFPRDRLIRTQIGSTLFQLGELAPAAAEYQRVLEIDPTDAGAHFNLGRIYRALGEAEKADLHQARFERFKADETVQSLVLGYLQSHPHDNLERQRIHAHAGPPPAPSEEE